MKIGILSRNKNCYSTKRLAEAAKKRGHKVKILNTLKFGVYIEGHELDLTYDAQALPELDAVIPRIGTSVTFYGTSIVRQFERMGIFCLSSSLGIAASRDKLRSLQTLSKYDIGITETAFVRNKNDVLAAIKRVGGAPVVIKLLEGTQGMGVILAETMSVAEAIVEAFQSTNHNVLIQKFVSESKGRDVRAFVVGDRVVAAMRRVAQGQEFRSNIHRGALAEKIVLDPHYERTAVRAAQILGLRVAGVDMLEGKDGPVIMEVNSSPGLEGIEGTTGVDVAGEIIDYMQDHIKFADLDVRQRLALAAGFSVTEFSVTREINLSNKSIQDSGLRERDIVILSIKRGSQILPIPDKNEIIQEGDTLLCYGRKNSLEDYLPELKKKKKKANQKNQIKKA